LAGVFVTLAGLLFLGYFLGLYLGPGELLEICDEVYDFDV
jgi:hypothetical protein